MLFKIIKIEIPMIIFPISPLVLRFYSNRPSTIWLYLLEGLNRLLHICTLHKSEMIYSYDNFKLVH